MREVEAAARGHGSQMTTAQRRAVEHQSVKAATEHFESEGWNVEDVGLYRPYDLHCTKGGRILHVEVKGSTGPLGTVALTAGELDDVRNHSPDTALFILHGIKLDGSRTKPRARGGDVYLEEPWRPKKSRLRPVAYSYRVS